MLVQNHHPIHQFHQQMYHPPAFNRVSRALNHLPLDSMSFRYQQGSVPSAAAVTFTPPVKPAERAYSIPEITRLLGSLEVHQPNTIQKFFNWFKSIFTIVDPNEDLKETVEKMFRNKTNAVALVQAYKNPRTGQFNTSQLQLDLQQLLPQVNPDLSAVKLNQISQIIASKAQNVSVNLVTQGSFPPAGVMPTRPMAVSSSPFEQKDIMVDGMRLRYIDVGPSNPEATLLMVHGHQSSLEEFNELIPLLRDKYRIVAFDLPGSGYSEQPDRDFSLEFYEDTILHFMDKMGIEKATIAGGSLGGNMSLRMGRKAPERFPSVISWSPAGVWHPKKFMSTMANTPLLETGLYWTMLRYQAPHWYKDSHPNKDELIYESMKYRREVDSSAFRRSTRQIAAQQLRDSHRGLGHLNKQPTLLLVGKEDTGLGLAENAIEFSEEMPNKELVIYENTGHSIHAERPADLARRMREFLAQQSGQ